VAPTKTFDHDALLLGPECGVGVEGLSRAPDEPVGAVRVESVGAGDLPFGRRDQLRVGFISRSFLPGRSRYRRRQAASSASNFLTRRDV
jgi:hypothetical protein